MSVDENSRRSTKATLKCREYFFQKNVPVSDEDKKWAEDLSSHMLKMSPTSMKVTLRQLREGRKLSTLHECLEMEYRWVYLIIPQKCELISDKPRADPINI